MTRIYRYADNAEKDRILDVILQTYGEEKQKNILAQWAWRYEDHPFKTDMFHPFFICEENEKIVGLTAFFPVILKVENYSIHGYNPIDTLTHPKHRGVGVRLMKKIIEDKPLLIGVANARTEKLWKKLKSPYNLDICKLFLFSCPINPGNIAYQKTRIALTRYLPSLKYYYRIIRNRDYGLDFVQIKEFGDDYDEFFHKASSSYKIIPMRNSQYLNWRFRDCPTEKYDIFLAKKNTKIKGYTVIKLFEGEDGLKRSRVIEIFAEYNDKETYNFMIDMAIRYAINKQADIFQFISTPNDPALMEALKTKKGLLTKKKVISNIIGQYEGLRIDRAFFHDEGNWHMTYGDFDQDFI